MAFWDRYRDADRLEEAALGFDPEATERPSGGVSVLGLTAAAAVIILVLMLFSAAPGLRLIDDAPIRVGDEMAAQRIADIATERRLAEARRDFRQSEVIDAHTSTFQAQTPSR